MIGQVTAIERELAVRLGMAGRLALFCDFDGTLSLLVPKPEDAVLLPGARAVLGRIASSRSIMAAVISGRALGDLSNRIGVSGIVLAGNHGLEIEGDGLHFLHPEAAKARARISEVCHRLGIQLRRLAGIQIEDKGLTATVHLRHTPPHMRTQACDIVRRAIADAQPPLLVRPGLLSLEIRPAVDWDKGRAALWILQRTGSLSAMTVCLGDDLTDEDLFRALPSGVTIKVGLKGPTAARWRLRDPGQVVELLAWLVEWAGRDPAPHGVCK